MQAMQDPVQDSAVSDTTSNQTGVDQVSAWFAEFGDELFAYASARVTDSNTAEDILQEALLAAVESWSSFRGESSPRTWLTAILRRKLLDHFRAQGRAKTISNTEPANYFSESGQWSRTLRPWPAEPHVVLQQREFWEVFDECRSKLTPPMAEVFVMREMDGLDSEGICSLLNISRSNLFVRLHRARLALRECLEKNWFTK